MRPIVFAAVSATLLLFPCSGSAHYHILLPDKAATQRDAPVRFTLRFGHPFEHQMFPTSAPASAMIVNPNGERTEITGKLEAVSPAAAGKADGYTWTVTPNRRGDHIVFVRCGPVWMEEEKEFLDDSVKFILHVQTQNGWDQAAISSFAASDAMELIPLTRPYGLRAGTVFQVQVRGQKPLPGTLVEVERYNDAPPKQLPPDEHITRTVKTDPNGVATVTLPDAGWWAITAVRDGGTRNRDGKSYPVKVRSTLWVPVDGSVPLTPAK